MQRRLVVFTVWISAAWLVGLAVVVLATALPAYPDNVIYSTYLGGDLADEGLDLVVDAAGNVYLTGFLQSTVLPTTTAVLAPQHGVDVFTAKLSASGSTADYFLWFNAISVSDVDEGYGIAIAADGSAIITGHTRSPDFCTLFGEVPGYDTTYNGNTDAFVVKIRPDGSGLVYCVFLGGSDYDAAHHVAVDAAGNAYVTGGTWSTDFPVTAGAFDTSHNGLRDTFIAKLDPTGTNLVYATFVGGSLQEESRALALDTADNAYVTGWTNSSDFYTTTHAFHPHYSGGFDAFVVKLNAAGNTMLFATYLGGSQEDRAMGLTVDTAGYAYVTGHTTSADFPTTASAFDQTHNGSHDAFVARLTPDGSGLDYATFLGGSGEDRARGLALDNDGVIYLTGETWSADFPTVRPLFDTLNGGQDAFIAQFSHDGTHLLLSSYWGGSDWDRGTAIAVQEPGYVYLTGATRSLDFPITPLAYDGTPNGDYDAFVSKVAIVPAPTYPLYLPAVLRASK